MSQLQHHMTSKIKNNKLCTRYFQVHTQLNYALQFTGLIYSFWEFLSLRANPGYHLSFGCQVSKSSCCESFHTPGFKFFSDLDCWEKYWPVFMGASNYMSDVHDSELMGSGVKTTEFVYSHLGHLIRRGYDPVGMNFIIWERLKAKDKRATENETV